MTKQGETAGDWTGWVGRTETRHDVLTQGVIDRLRATIDSDASGPVAPQGIHWCLCLPDAPTDRLGADGHPMRGTFMPPIPLPRRMWAASEVSFLAPVSAGATIDRRSTISAVHEKSGSSGRLVFVSVDHAIDANGIPAIRERQTIVYREAAAGPLGGASPMPAAAVPSGQRTLVPGAPLLMRYSALTFNAHRIHYDLPYARDAEGYPGLVVHGPLTATLLLDLAGRQLGHNRLTRFAFRGVAPAFADVPLTLSLDRDDDAIRLAATGPSGPVMQADART